MPSPIQAVFFDWAGTTVDYGSRAPAQVFREIFHRRGVEITEPEARGPMGYAKRQHIALVAALPRVAALWTERHGKAPDDDDVEAMYQDFLPLQQEVLAAHCDVIPGVPEAVAFLRERGLKIGSSTGYTRELMEIVAPRAAQGGYAPDVLVCPDEVASGRPQPWMNFRIAEKLGVYPLSRVLVVDDTPVGLEAGRNSGAFTIGVSQTGNALGLSQAEVGKLPAAELQKRLAEIEQQFLAAGADLVLKSAAELPSRWDEIERLVVERR